MRYAVAGSARTMNAVHVDYVDSLIMTAYGRDASSTMLPLHIGRKHALYRNWPRYHPFYTFLLLPRLSEEHFFEFPL